MSVETINHKLIDISRIKELISLLKSNLSEATVCKLRIVFKEAIAHQIYSEGKDARKDFNTLINTLYILVNELGLKDESLISTILLHPVKKGLTTTEKVEEEFGKEVADIVRGLLKVEKISDKEESFLSENYLRLLVTIAEDFRVVLIRLARALYYMRNIEQFEENFKLKMALKVKHVYIPLTHKLGLYRIKLEMDDLYLRYVDADAYDYIVRKLKDSEAARNKFIQDFIAPVRERLEASGLKYEIKGRVKSISSIDNKLKKQNADVEDIYDIFAIRVILDSLPHNEKAECWQVYSMVTDLYLPNPKRLKDWLSIPKSNGYESLHITVMGPNYRWVEVQIRTKRMDEIAEKGLAAHWKYKGLKSESKVDEWLSSLREIIENKTLGQSEKIDDFKLEIYDEEIYVFTPKGDLHKLPQRSTVLDFAFAIHSRVGCTCVSGKVNGRNVSIKHQLKNGDQVEIITSANQHPKQDWLQYVNTTKAKNKIRQYLKEEKNKHIEISKELLSRRFKNKKIEMSDAVLMRTINKFGCKNLTDFYIELAEKKIDVNNFMEQYLLIEKRMTESESAPIISADTYVSHAITEKKDVFAKKDELILDANLTGISYSLAACCSPIFGDDVFGFISNKGIKIHRRNCPNSNDMFSRFAYRVIPARWNGASESNYVVSLRIVGHDDINIINTITSIIAKENEVEMTGISIQSGDGIFHGIISVRINSRDKLNKLTKKIQGVKGVRSVMRRG